MPPDYRASTVTQHHVDSFDTVSITSVQQIPRSAVPGPAWIRRRPIEHVDVLIVGAGLSGIGAACHLQRATARARRYAILESRDAIGGTWDLFRYPGIRSDSDMFTLGYALPAVEGREGDRRRRRRSAATSATPPASTASSDKSASTTGRARRLVERRRALDGRRPSAPTPARPCSCTCSFLFGCSGYYRYDEGFTPDFEGERALHRARSSTRSTGPRTSTTPASASSSSAAAPPRSRWCRRWRERRRST